jgi:CheY-like chemotaxis protein
VVPNGKLAVEAVRASHFDLVLMDLHMPEMDGLTASRIIREEAELRGRGGPTIVACSADMQPSTQEACAEVGIVSYLMKPIKLKELKSTLESALSYGGRPTTTTSLDVANQPDQRRAPSPANTTL